MKNQRSLSAILTAAGILAALTLLSSCLKNHDNLPAPHAAGLMGFNLSSDQPVAGIALSGNIINAPLPYTGYTGGYVAIYPGNRKTVSFNWNNKQTLASDSFSYQAGKYYSLFITGEAGNYYNVIVNDGLDSLRSAPGKSYIRYINAVPDSSGLTVVFTSGENNITGTNVAFDSVSSFMPVDSGSLNVSINSMQKMSSRDIILKAGSAYTLLFVKDPDSSASDSMQIRYIVNGKIMQDSTAEQLEKPVN